MSEEITHQFPKNGFEIILARLDTLDLQMETIGGKVVALEDKVDRRLMDTRPLWEQVLQRFDGLDSRFDGLDSRFDGVDSRLDKVDSRLEGVENHMGKVETNLEAVEQRLGKVEHELYSLGKKFRLFNQEIIDWQNAQEDLGERVDQLERVRPT